MTAQQYDRDPRHGRRTYVMFTLVSGVKVTLSCTFNAHLYSSPSAQCMAEHSNLFRKPVRLADIHEVHPVFRGREYRRVLASFSIN